MKTSWLPVTHFKDILSGALPVEQWIDQAASLNIDAVDASCLFFQGPGRLDPMAFRKATDRANLQVAVFNTYTDFTHPNPEQRQREQDDFARHLVNAVRIGARMVRITAGQAHPGLDRETGIRLAVEGLRRVAMLAKKAGVRAVYENHSKPGVWTHSDFSHPAAIFCEIAERIRNEPIGILFDTANAVARGDDPLLVLESVVDRVECVHIADSATCGALNPTVIGTGMVPFAALFKRLKAAGYDGWFSIEEASGKADGIIRALEYFRSGWSR
jgi:sugar phosphate isomerase/epimerase